MSRQEEFNASLLPICDEKLKVLFEEIEDIDVSIYGVGEEDAMDTRNLKLTIRTLKLYNQLFDIRQTLKPEDAREFLHIITVINNALPTKKNQPTKTDIDELIALGHASEGRPSPLWKAVGITMILLGAAIAITAGIVLTTPVGMAIAAAGAISALTGVGFFAYGNARTGLSGNIMDITETLQQQPSSLSSC